MEQRQDGASKPKSLALEKMETLVRQMQSADSGVPVRCQKLFLTTIPSAFMGYDLIEWLMENLPIDDSGEALHLASLLCQHGYFFPVGDAKTLQVKDDSSLYRFQTPYYWPSQNHVPDSTDYAIYLHKKISKNKQKHGLEDCELEAYNQLKKALASKWDFVTMQADEQLKMAKDRKKGDKIVSESQERAYWRVYRPPPGFTNTLETRPVPDRSRPPPAPPAASTSLRQQLSYLKLSVTRLRIKISQVAESMISHYETYLELDPFLSPVQPSNPWLSDDTTFMELNEPLVEFPTERRIRRWAISMEEAVSDPTGLQEFTTCMRKEFSHENIRFWSAVHQLRKAALSQVEPTVRSIYDEFLRPGAPCEINIDGKTMEKTQELLKKPTRFTYDYAADHIFDLNLKKDCYPRFLRSEHYKSLLLNATNPMISKKRFFTFGAPGKKKISTVTPPNVGQLVASSGRLSGEDAAGAGGSANPKPDCDPPYRKEEDAGIFLGGPSTPPPAVKAAPPAATPSQSPQVARPAGGPSDTAAAPPAAPSAPSVPPPAASSATPPAASPPVPSAAPAAASSAVAVIPPSTTAVVPVASAPTSASVPVPASVATTAAAPGKETSPATGPSSTAAPVDGGEKSSSTAAASATPSAATAAASSGAAVSQPPSAAPAAAAEGGVGADAAFSTAESEVAICPAPEAGATEEIPAVVPPPPPPDYKFGDGLSGVPSSDLPSHPSAAPPDDLAAPPPPLSLPPPDPAEADPAGWGPAIAPPAMFQDLASPPLPPIQETEEPVAPRTELVTLTDSCAQTVETGDCADYGATTDKECEANIPRERGTRRKEKRVKICEGAAAAGEPPAEGEGEKRRSRGSGDSRKERKESRSRRDQRKKSSGERRKARLEAGETEGVTGSPKRGDVVAPAPQKLDDTNVCPWENEESCKLDAPFVKTYATLGYL